MGQINSTRNQGRHEPGAIAADRPACLDVPARNSPPALVTSRPNVARGAHRKSLRNSVAGLLRPRDVEEGIAHNATKSKKWWRRLRRRSNVHPVRQDAISAAGGDTPQTSSPVVRGSLSDGLESSVSPTQPSLHAIIDDRESTSEPRNFEAHTSTPVSSSKGKERALETPSSAINDSLEATPSTLGSGNVSREASSSNTINSGAVPDSTAYPHLEVVDGNGGSGEAAAPMPDQPASQPMTDAAFMNLFPPEGTLVVVQGVVHAENASRLIHGSPPPPSPLRPTNRPSGSNSIAQQLADSLRSEHASSDLSGSEDSGSSASEGSATVASRDTTDSAWRSEPSGDTPLGSGPRDVSQREDAASPIGVDVLGTLLRIVSVATATTAASLLSSPNGRSTRPFAPAGLSDMPATSASAERSAFSALARALASTSPSAAAILSQGEQEREERERTRSRSIWEGLRDRVSNSRGSRTVSESGQRSQSSPFLADSDRTNDGFSVPDTLFSELARTFSLGLPSDDRPSQAQTSSFSRPSSEQQQSSFSEGEEPQDRNADSVPPDSFEQFLVDLLSDLRVALLRNDTPSTAVSEGRHDENIQGEDAGNSSRTGDANSAEHILQPRDHAESSLSDSMYLSTRGIENEELGPHTVDDHAMQPASSTPLIVPNDPSHANFTSADRPMSSSEHPRQINNGSRLEETDTSASTASTMRLSDSDVPASRNRTNWWRMYQFPPMLTAQITQNNAETHRSGSEQAPFLPTSRTNATASADFSDPIDSTSRESANTLIPVILVGLQSISTGSRPSPLWTSATEHVDGINERGRERMDTGTTGTTGSRGSAVPQSVPGSWPSRAARAFGRMGRREEVGTTAPEPSGNARTFFIYVFGGHYPPNHRILSGSDVFDNSEALWELADFLGQVRPPVVTQEDIERSGLVLFKASSLGEYESARRVANNCVDRCLICLDDYAPNDDLRLLSCKHAFHKACVDQWLKIGRNNCPACRGEGVKTDSGPTIPSL